MVRYLAVIKLGASLPIMFLAGCMLFPGCTPPKETTPALTVGTATTLLHINPKSKNWLTRVRRDDASCDYRIELPDQSSHPTVIDVGQIIYCNGKPAPRALNASVTYTYDKNAGHWVITRFSS